MKKIFTLLTAILLSASMGWAQSTMDTSMSVSTKRKAAQLSPETMVYGKVFKLNNGNYCKIGLFSSEGLSSYFQNNVPMTASNVIAGTHEIPSANDEGNYVWSSGGYKYSYAYGTITFTYTGKESGGYPIYRVQYNVNAAKGFWETFVLDQEIPIRSYLADGTTPNPLINDPSFINVIVESGQNQMGTVEGSTIVEKGTEVTIRAIANEQNNYIFKHWKEDESVENPRTFTTSEQNYTYTAVFEEASSQMIDLSMTVENISGQTVNWGAIEENNVEISQITKPIDSHVTINAVPSSSDYYFVKWQNNHADFLNNSNNPLVITVTEATTYTAIFAQREEINITANSDLTLIKSGGSWSVSGMGSISSNNYAINISVDASSLTGNFNSEINTSNTWVQKSNEEKVYAQDISVVTVTEPTAGRLQINAIIIGSDQNKYIITGYYDEPILGLWGTFSWDNPNQHISINTTQSTGTQCEAQWSPTVNNFMYIQAYDDTYSTDNYVIIYLATSQSSSYKGYDNANISGPKKDQTYIFEESSTVPVQAPCYGDMWNSNITFYRWEYLSERAVPYMYNSWCGWDGFDNIGCLGRCAQSSVVGSKPAGDNNLTVNTTTRVISDDYYVTTTEGKDGKPFIRLYDDSDNLLIVIGAPAPPVNNHTVTITDPTNGTITVLDGETPISDGGEVEDGTTLTISAAGNTGYHLTALTVNGNAFTSGNTYDLDDDITIAATFAANAYTVTFNKNNESATGSMDNQAFTYGTAQNLSDNGFIAPTGMHFTGWATEENGAVVYTNKEEVSNLTATQNGEVELFAKWAYNTYTVVFNKNNEDATGTMANQAFTYGTAQNLTPNGFTSPDPERYDFAGWATEENGAVVYTNGEEVTNLTAVHEGTVTLYAKWIEAFALIDDKDAGNSYYDETLAGKVGQTLSVHYMREFPKKQWAAFSLPFGYSYQKKGNNTFKDQVYYLISAEYEVEGGKAYLTLNCMPNTLGIVANKPYILIPNETIVNPVFNNVKMKPQALNYYSVPCTNIGVDDPVETVEFRNTLTRMQFANNDHRQIYLVGSKLRYPNNGTSIRAFRGYFYMQEGTIQHIQPRLRNVETGEIIEAEEETNTTVETKKYIENGILVIERAGMKYDAQGHVIK